MRRVVRAPPTLHTTLNGNISTDFPPTFYQLWLDSNFPNFPNFPNFGNFGDSPMVGGSPFFVEVVAAPLPPSPRHPLQLSPSPRDPVERSRQALTHSAKTARNSSKIDFKAFSRCIGVEYHKIRKRLKTQNKGITGDIISIGDMKKAPFPGLSRFDPVRIYKCFLFLPIDDRRKA